MRKITFFIVALLYSATSFGQMTFPFEEDFETYIADAKFVEQASNTTNWTTWSDNPGGSEDPNISSTYASSGNNSVKIGAGNDLVLLTGDLTTGRYAVTFNMYIPNGTLGYYNMLQDFAGGNSKWAYQILFGGGEATVQGTSEEYFTYASDTWFELRTIVDLDTDWCEIYKDGKLVYEFKWSAGTSSTNTKQLSAVNFYGWDADGAGTPEYYFDDIEIKTVTAPSSPVNFSAVLENTNDIKLTWEVPTDMTPDSYNIYKNGALVADALTTLTYTDLGVYPMAYEYVVKAFYSAEGFSKPTTATISIDGGVDRKNVVFEVATGTWCVNCPAAARGVDQLHNEGKNVSIIEYHGGDTYETVESAERIAYYGITGYPTAVIDGKASIVGGNRDGSMYESYLNAYNYFMTIPAVVDMDMTIVRTGETTYKATITTTEEFKYYTSDLKLRIALNESNIEESWFGMTEIDFVNRDMIQDAAGLDIDFSTETSHEFTVNFELSTEFVRENCELVAFVQHDGTKEIANSVVDTLPSHIIGVKYNQSANNISLYPNPVENNLYVKGIETADKIEVRSISGQLIYSGSDISLFNNGFNTSELASGLYTIIIYSNNEANVLRFVK